MPMSLILSSHVAASCVGGQASSRILQVLGSDSMLVPTVLYGRHPGWGEPGGGPVDDDQMRAVLRGISEQNLYALTDIVLTGYFTEVGQVFAAAEAMDAVRATPRPAVNRAHWDRAILIVDPIMGDSPHGLYVPKPVAAAIKDQLISRADMITPNLFELGHITGRPLTDQASILRAARAIEKPVLVSSLPCEGQIGTLFADENEAWLVKHDRLPKVPNGTGDALTACFTGALLRGADARQALEHACSAVFALVRKAQEWSSQELPIVAAQNLLREPDIILVAEPV